jgi:hypothetical protein
MHPLDQWLARLIVPFTGTNETFIKCRKFFQKRLLKKWWPKDCPYELAKEVENYDIPACSILWLEAKMQHLGIRYLEKKRTPSLRLIMALFGGIAIIVPMLIMALHSSRTTNLVTTSVATFLFAIIIAFGAKGSSGKDVLVGTAAYAAVLVVFVGTSMTMGDT